MSVLLFPGQGSQNVGMGLEFYENFPLVKNIFKQADEELKYPLSKIIIEGPAEELQLTKNTQPAILTVSYSIFRVLNEEFGIEFNSYKFFAGHSLGEYSALLCSNSINFSDALYLLSERGKAMQDAVPVGEGSMIAVLGLKTTELNNLIKDKNLKGICEIANDNAEGQVILSGDTENISLFQKLLKDKKIKSIPLKVSAPFHCSLMKPASEVMKDKINKINFKKPINQIVCNVNAKPESDPNVIKKLLVDQIFSTVKWRESLIFMSQMGEKNFIEIGPGKALTGMVKRTLNNVNCFSINSITDIKNLQNELKK